jgi:hypothetical protein
MKSLLDEYATALTDLAIACARLQASIFRIAVAPKVRLTVIAGRPVSAVAGRAKLTVVKEQLKQNEV